MSTQPTYINIKHIGKKECLINENFTNRVKTKYFLDTYPKAVTIDIDQNFHLLEMFEFKVVRIRSHVEECLKYLRGVHTLLFEECKDWSLIPDSVENIETYYFVPELTRFRGKVSIRQYETDEVHTFQCRELTILDLQGPLPYAFNLEKLELEESETIENLSIYPKLRKLTCSEVTRLELPQSVKHVYFVDLEAFQVNEDNMVEKVDFEDTYDNSIVAEIQGYDSAKEVGETEILERDDLISYLCSKFKHLRLIRYNGRTIFGNDTKLASIS